MSTKPKAAKTAGESARAKAAKVALSRASRARASQSPGKSFDDAIVIELGAVVADLRRHDDDGHRQAARIVEWAASANGRALRDWLVALKARQAAAPTEQEVSELVPFKDGWTARQYVDELDLVIAKWHASVVSDGRGNPLQIDVAKYIDSLAYWIASTRLPSPWMRIGSLDRRKHLAKVRAKAKELADLLDWGNGPEWPSALELFEQTSRPILSESMPLREYRSMVVDRLRAQTVPQLLHRLIERTMLQVRIDEREAKEMLRPNTGEVLDRMQAKRMQWWFANHARLSSGNALYKFIADLINAGRSEALQSTRKEATADLVREWLRKQ